MFSQYERLNVHVMASDMTVIRAASRMLKCPRDPKQRAVRHKWYRQMLSTHKQARALFVRYRF